MPLNDYNMRLGGDKHEKLFIKSYDKAKQEAVKVGGKEVTHLSHALETFKVKLRRIWNLKTGEWVNNKTQLRELNKSLISLLDGAITERGKLRTNTLSVGDLNTDVTVLNQAITQAKDIIQRLKAANADQNELKKADLNLKRLNYVLKIFVKKQSKEIVQTQLSVASLSPRQASSPQPMSTAALPPSSSISPELGAQQVEEHQPQNIIEGDFSKSEVPSSLTGGVEKGLKIKPSKKRDLFEKITSNLPTSGSQISKLSAKTLGSTPLRRESQQQTAPSHQEKTLQQVTLEAGKLSSVPSQQVSTSDSEIDIITPGVMKARNERGETSSSTAMHLVETEPFLNSLASGPIECSLNDPLVKKYFTSKGHEESYDELFKKFGEGTFTFNEGDVPGVIICTPPKVKNEDPFSFVYQLPQLLLTDKYTHEINELSQNENNQVSTTDAAHKINREGKQHYLKEDSSQSVFSFRGLVTAAGAFLAASTLMNAEPFNPPAKQNFVPNEPASTLPDEFIVELFPPVLEENLPPPSTILPDASILPDSSLEGSFDVLPPLVAGLALLAACVGSCLASARKSPKESVNSISRRAEILDRKRAIGISITRSLLLNSPPKEIEIFAEGTRPIIDSKLKKLMESFLEEKRLHGDETEKRLYQDMSLEQFIDRLLQKRPSQVLRNGVVSMVGQPSRSTYNDYMKKTSLEERLCPEEIEISTYLVISGAAHIAEPEADLQKTLDPHRHAIFYGCVDNQPLFQDFTTQNNDLTTVGDVHYFVQPGINRNEGAGAEKWKEFFEIDNFFPGDNQMENLFEKERSQRIENLSQRFIEIKQTGEETGFFLDTYLYRKVMEMKLKPFLIDANERAQAEGKKARICLINLASEYSLNVHTQMQEIQVECYLQIIREYGLSNITELDFNNKEFNLSKDYKKNISDLLPTLRISFTDHDARQGFGFKNESQSEDELLCVQYPWHPLSLPGVYIDGTTEIFKPFAQRTTISYMHNFEVNPNVSGNKARFDSTAPPQKGFVKPQIAEIIAADEILKILPNVAYTGAGVTGLQCQMMNNQEYQVGETKIKLKSPKLEQIKSRQIKDDWITPSYGGEDAYKENIGWLKNDRVAIASKSIEKRMSCTPDQAVYQFYESHQGNAHILAVNIGHEKYLENDRAIIWNKQKGLFKVAPELNKQPDRNEGSFLDHCSSAKLLKILSEYSFDFKEEAFLYDTQLLSVTNQNQGLEGRQFLQEPVDVSCVITGVKDYTGQTIDCSSDSEAFSDATKRIQSFLLTAATGAVRMKMEKSKYPVALIIEDFASKFPPVNLKEYSQMISTIYKKELQCFDGFFDEIIFLNHEQNGNDVLGREVK